MLNLITTILFGFGLALVFNWLGLPIISQRSLLDQVIFGFVCGLGGTRIALITHKLMFDKAL